MPTRKIGFTALGTAVYSRLTTHANTSSYTFYASGAVPDSATEPYHVIKLGPGNKDMGFSTRDTEAEQNMVQIDSYVDKTSGAGPKACADMMNNIIQAITSSALTVSGYDNPYITTLDFSDIMPPEDPTDPVQHGIVRMRFQMAPSG